jgi:hypothetical protein
MLLSQKPRKCRSDATARSSHDADASAAGAQFYVIVNLMQLIGEQGGAEGGR